MITTKIYALIWETIFMANLFNSIYMQYDVSNPGIAVIGVVHVVVYIGSAYMYSEHYTESLYYIYAIQCYTLLWGILPIYRCGYHTALTFFELYFIFFKVFFNIFLKGCFEVFCEVVFKVSFKVFLV